MTDKRKVQLNLEMRLKSGYTREEFYFFLSHSLAHFVQPDDLHQFKKEYLPDYWSSREESLHLT